MSLRRHCTITGVGNVKQASFKPGPEDCYGRCGSDKIWQTVPDMCSGDQESLVTDGKESGAADNQWWRWTGTESLTSLDICHLTKLVSKVCRCGPVMQCCLPGWQFVKSVSSASVSCSVLLHYCHKCNLICALIFLTSESCISARGPEESLRFIGIWIVSADSIWFKRDGPTAQFLNWLYHSWILCHRFMSECIQ